MNARLREIILVLVALAVFHISYLYAETKKEEQSVAEQMCWVLVKNAILKRCSW